MIVSKRSGFSATELNDAYIFIFLFTYFFYFTFFCPYEYQKNAVYSLHNKNRSLTYRVCGKQQDKHGKELHFSNIPL